MSLRRRRDVGDRSCIAAEVVITVRNRLAPPLLLFLLGALLTGCDGGSCTPSCEAGSDGGSLRGDAAALRGDAVSLRADRELDLRELLGWWRAVAEVKPRVVRLAAPGGNTALWLGLANEIRRAGVQRIEVVGDCNSAALMLLAALAAGSASAPPIEVRVVNFRARFGLHGLVWPHGRPASAERAEHQTLEAWQAAGLPAWFGEEIRTAGPVARPLSAVEEARLGFKRY